MIPTRSADLRLQRLLHRQVLQLAMDNNPNMLDALFTPRECVLHCTRILAGANIASCSLPVFHYRLGTSRPSPRSGRVREAAICSTYSKIAKELHPEAGDLGWLDLDTQAGEDYWIAMNRMGDYAKANHDCIHDAMAEAMGETAGGSRVLARQKSPFLIEWAIATMVNSTGGPPGWQKRGIGMAPIDDVLVKVERLKNLLVSRATGNGVDEGEYVRLRDELLKESLVKAHLPRFVRSCATVSEFWSFIQPKFKSYQERRVFLADEFSRLLTKLEDALGSPAVDSSSEVLSVVDSEHVQEAWQKAMDRRASDPDGAITMARTLLETVCKFILDEQEIEYDDTADLPKLYRAVAESLTLAPSQHTEPIIKQVLGGCTAVVEGLGALRSKTGDAHGRGKQAGKPKQRHAALAVNLAGSMASFLVATWQERAA